MKKILAILSFVAFGSLGASAGEIEITCCDGTQTCIVGIGLATFYINTHDIYALVEYAATQGEFYCPNGCWKSVRDAGPAEGTGGRLK